MTHVTSFEEAAETPRRGPWTDRGESYESLLALHGPYLLRLARSVLRNDDEAADALQEAFVTVFRKLDGFRGEARVSTWMHRIVLNTCLLRLRRRRRRPEHPVELLDGLCQDGPSAVDALERQQEARRVRAAIDALPPTHRVVISLCDLEELPAADVARRLGISVNAVKIRLCRARRALRGVLIGGRVPRPVRSEPRGRARRAA